MSPIIPQTAETEDGISQVKLLLQRVVRGFYEPRHAIVLDIILYHSAIRDDHLAVLMGLQNLDVRKLCGRLREDRIITLHTKLETKEGQTRPIHRSYYYVDYRDAVDSIKYRIHKLVRIVEEASKNDFDSKGYVCPLCHRRYGALDVLPLVSMDGQSFNCATCNSALHDDEESIETKASQERLGRLQRQTSKLVMNLKAIDAAFVPHNDAVIALANAIPPNVELSYTDAYPHGRPTPKTNVAESATTASLGVSIDYGTRQEDGEEEKAKLAAQALKNTLPEWHRHSTVPGSYQSSGVPDFQRDVAMEEVKEVKLDATAADEVAEYYRALREQQKDSSDDEEEEEEEEFESVAPSVADPAASSLKQEDDSEEEDEFEDV